MCTSFSSSISYIGGLQNPTSYQCILRTEDVNYLCFYREFDLISNAVLLATGAGNVQTTNNPQLLDVFYLDIKVDVDFPLLQQTRDDAPLVNSLLFYIIECSEDQVTDYKTKNVQMKELPLYSCAKDIIYFKRYKPHIYEDDNDVGVDLTKLKWDVYVRLNKHLIVKPGHRLKACFVIYGRKNTLYETVTTQSECFICGVSNLKYRSIF